MSPRLFLVLDKEKFPTTPEIEQGLPGLAVTFTRHSRVAAPDFMAHYRECERRELNSVHR